MGLDPLDFILGQNRRDQAPAFKIKLKLLLIRKFHIHSQIVQRTCLARVGR